MTRVTKDDIDLASLFHEDHWRKCSSCKKNIAFKQKFWICSVTTCQRTRTGLVFCEVSCFDAHLPLLRHREAWALEKTAPSRDDWKAQIDSGELKPLVEREKKADEEKPLPSGGFGAASGPAKVIRRNRG